MLPEKWCIQVTEENKHIVGKLYDDRCSSFSGETKCYTNGSNKFPFYIGSHSGKDHIGNEPASVGKKRYDANFITYKDRYPEITLEDFIKYVLKQESKEATYEIY